MKHILLFLLLLATPAFSAQPTPEEALTIFYNVSRVRVYLRETYQPAGVGFDAQMTSVHPVTLRELKTRLMLSDEELKDVLFYDNRLYRYRLLEDGVISEQEYVGIRWREAMLS